MIWRMSSGGKVMSAACWCCSEDMIVGSSGLAGSRMAQRILMTMREDQCYRSIICPYLGVLEGCTTMMARDRCTIYTLMASTRC